MPYEVISPGPITLLRALSVHKDDNDKVIGYDHESVLRTPGEVVSDEDVSPVVVTLYDDGDAHVTSILKRVEQVNRGGRPRKTKEEASD